MPVIYADWKQGVIVCFSLSPLTHLNKRLWGEGLIGCDVTAVPHRLEFMFSI